MSKADAVVYKKFPDHPSRDRNLLKGRLGHLTAKEKQALQVVLDKYDWGGKYSNFLIPGEHPETCALRWLRARNFDLVETDRMITDHMAWRERFDIDKKASTSYNDLLGADLEKVVLPAYPQGFCGQDKCGRLVYVKLVGKLDVPGLLDNVSVEDFVNFEVAMMERSKWLNGIQRAKVGHHVEEYFSIVDLAGFSLGLMKPSVMSFLRTIAVELGSNYPEQNGGMYIINSPYVFNMVWNSISLFVDKATCAKIKILGSDYKKVLLSKVDKSQLPKEYGGTGMSLKECCYSYGNVFYTPRKRPSPTASLRGSYDFIRQLDERGSEVAIESEERGVDNYGGENRAQLEESKDPIFKIAEKNKNIGEERQEKNLEVKFAAASPASPKPGLHKKIDLETKQATLDDLQPKTVSDNRNRAAVDNAITAHNTSNMATKGNESDLANNFPATHKAPDAAAMAHKEAVPDPNDPRNKVGWDKVKYLALGNNHRVDLASAVRIKSSVEAMKNVNAHDETTDKTKVRAHVETTDKTKVRAKSIESTNVCIDNDQNIRLHQNPSLASEDALGVDSTHADDVELHHNPTRESSADGVVKDKYEEAEDALLDAYDAIILDDNTFDSPRKHPIQDEPWDIKDAELDYGRTCAGPNDCIVS